MNFSQVNKQGDPKKKMDKTLFLLGRPPLIILTKKTTGCSAKYFRDQINKTRRNFSGLIFRELFFFEGHFSLGAQNFFCRSSQTFCW